MQQTHRLIIIASVLTLGLIAAALFVVLRPDPGPITASVAKADRGIRGDTGIRLVEATDHIYGNPAAPIVFVTYSDFACPYCREFHETMRMVVEEYGSDGEFAWVFRHMPIVRLHQHAATYALASECVAQNMGNPGFWDFADRMYATATPENILTAAELTDMAAEIGVPAEDFRLCMRDGSLMERVERDFDEALDAGATATPFTVIVTGYQHIVREGTRPYEVVAATVDAMLRNLGHGSEHEDDLPNLFEDLEALDTPEAAERTEIGE